MKVKGIFSSQSQTITQQRGQKDGAIRDLSAKAPVQKQPAVLKDTLGTEHKVFIDVVTRYEGRVVILGWSTSPLMSFSVSQNNQILATTLTRHMRGDVADALNLDSRDMLGFSLISDDKADDYLVSIDIKLLRSAIYETGPLGEATALTEVQRTLLPALLEGKIAALKDMQIGTTEWWATVDELPECTVVPARFNGFLEGIWVSPIGNAVVFGWAQHPEHAIIWLEDEMQNVCDLNSVYRYERADISRNVVWTNIGSGLIAYFPEVSNNPSIKLRAVTEQGLVTVHACSEVELLPADPRSVAKKLFSILTPERDYHSRAGIVDLPVLLPLIDQYQKEVSSIEPNFDVYGDITQSPKVSIIIPLYKRFDFMENQFLEFVRDPFFKVDVELIYVIDDPEIRTEVLNTSDHLFKLYNLPFKVLSGFRNRGFSGANNLGVQHASAEHLIFMNSDVIPITPGWVEKMLEECVSANLGAVGVRLLFPDGSIQQDGLKLVMHADLPVTLPSDHNAGIDPQALSNHEEANIDCLSGACILITKEAFSQVGGWNEGLVLSLGADVALSQGLRKHGYEYKLVLDTPLIHLGQQSISSVGDWHFRHRARLMNALYLKELLSCKRNIEVSDN